MYVHYVQIWTILRISLKRSTILDHLSGHAGSLTRIAFTKQQMNHTVPFQPQDRLLPAGRCPGPLQVQAGGFYETETDQL
jgi:hypothetical protein